MIEWLSAAERAAQISAWGFIIGLLGLPFTLLGLLLTYLQAKRARLSAEQVETEVKSFKIKYDRSDAVSCLADAKASMDIASVLIVSGNWKEASEAYDGARKSIQRIRHYNFFSMQSSKKLKLIVAHLESFSKQVDNALHGKEEYPDLPSVKSAIRKNTDDITLVQRELNEGIG